MSTITPNKTKATALTQVQALIAGIEKHFPSGTITLGNTAYVGGDADPGFPKLGGMRSPRSARRT